MVYRATPCTPNQPNSTKDPHAREGGFSRLTQQKAVVRPAVVEDPTGQGWLYGKEALAD